MRHQFLLASVGAITLTGSAFAADLTPPPPPPVPVFTWTGPYLGGQVGYAWATGANNVSGVDPYTGVAFASSIGQTPSGVIGGANVGYNYEIPQWSWFSSSGVVIGLEGTVDGTGLTNTGTLAFPDRTSLTAQTTATVQGSIRGRLGIAWDRLLIYGTGGVAFGGFDTQYNYDGSGATIGKTHLAPFFGTSSFSNTRVGWTVGGGIQYAITNAWSVRVEYRYTDWGRINETLFGGTVFPTVFPTFGFFGDRHVQQNQVQVGFDYRFDLLPPPPVVAKY
ncbi:MAG TPA: outer membrane protein [Methylocella sp.]|nr:outer membrane protein [Methylocella sp.]